MGAIWAVISLLAVWLIYGLIASIFVKGVTSRDGLKLILAGMLGGYLGGQIGIFMDVPENLWWMREVTKLLLTIGSLNIIHRLGFIKKRGEQTYFLGMLAAFSKFPFSSITPHRFDKSFVLNKKRFFFQIAKYP